MSDEATYLNRAKVRMTYYQTEWPEYRELKRLENERGESAADIRVLVAKLMEARKALKDRRQRELVKILEQVKADEKLRGLITTATRNKVRAKWKKRQEREIMVRHMEWNRETLDLIDPIDDAEESYDLEQARKHEWETKVKPRLQEEYAGYMDEEVRFHAGLNPDWEDTWPEEKQEVLRLIERKLRRGESTSAW